MNYIEIKPRKRREKMEKLLIFLLFISNLAQAQQPTLQAARADNRPFLQNTIELEYRIFSPEILYSLGDDTVLMIPKVASQPGLRFTSGNLSIAFNKSVFSENSQSGGLDLAYSWDNSFIQAYHIWASGYRVQLNSNGGKKIDLGDRENMTVRSADSYRPEVVVRMPTAAVLAYII